MQWHTFHAGLALCLAAFPAQAQEHPAVEMTDQAQTLTAKEPEKAKTKPEFLIVPIPISNPATGTGLTLAAVIFYNPNHASQPWVSGIAAMGTKTGTKAIGGFHSMSLGDDKFRLLAFAGYADAKLKFYGIGPNAGARNVSVDIEDKGVLGVLQAQMRLFPYAYFGARYELLSIQSRVEIPHPDFPDLNLPPLEADSKLSMIGPALTYDSRDSSTNPRKGMLVNLNWMFGVKALGSDFEHDKFTLQANGYFPVTSTTVFAARGAMCSTSTRAPFYDLCMYGQSGDLRGYETGRYRDRASWALQAEVRQHLFWRLGAVAFAGVGGIAPDAGSIFNHSTVLPAAGAGLRVLVAKRSNVNLRLDAAWGKGSHAIYFGVGEAF